MLFIPKPISDQVDESNREPQLTFKSSKSLKMVDDISIESEIRQTKKVMKTCKNIGKLKGNLFGARTTQRTSTQLSQPAYKFRKFESTDSLRS